MCSTEIQANTGSVESQTIADSNDESTKLALAVCLLRSKLLQKQPPSSDSDALRWKRKAKERKQELVRIREEFKEIEDAAKSDLFPRSASCKCYFFDNLGKVNRERAGDGSNRRFNDVLRRRFLRQVRFKERRREPRGSNQPGRYFSEFDNEDELEQLRSSVDFLVELCDTVSPVEETNIANLSHQAVDFILASLKNLLFLGKYAELIEGTVSNLIGRLVKRICFPLEGKESHYINSDAQFYIQHLIRKLGSEPYIGQRAMLSVSHEISVLAESLLSADPFDAAFPNMHECMFIMIQLIEFLITDYLLMWSNFEGFDNILFEEWVTSVLHAREASVLLENRNGLYVLYMDRVIGELAKLIGQSSSLQKLNHILDQLFL